MAGTARQGGFHVGRASIERTGRGNGVKLERLVCFLIRFWKRWDGIDMMALTDRKRVGGLARFGGPIGTGGFRGAH